MMYLLKYYRKERKKYEYISLIFSELFHKVRLHFLANESKVEDENGSGGQEMQQLGGYPTPASAPPSQQYYYNT